MQQIYRLLSIIVISAFAIVARAQYDDEIQIPIPQWHMTQMTQDRHGMMWFDLPHSGSIHCIELSYFPVFWKWRKSCFATTWKSVHCKSIVIRR